MTSDRITVEPSVLVWARESMGFSEEAAAKRLNVREAMLGRWERGEVDPTIKQLRNVAKQYCRPLAVLLLSRPPEDFQPLRDFRRILDHETDALSPELNAEIRRAQSQREVFLELAELAPDLVSEYGELPSLTLADDVEASATLLRRTLGVDSTAFPRFSGPDDALRYWIPHVESLGVIVVQFSRVDTREVRGFSIGESPFPVVALNGADWARARLFTLVHELTHLSLRSGGLCDLHEARDWRESGIDADEIEHFCNAVSAAVLMPKAQFRNASAELGLDNRDSMDLDDIQNLSGRFGVSSEAALLRLVGMGLTTWDVYWTLKPELEARYQEARELRIEAQRASEGLPLYYITKARNLGRNYVTTVIEAYRSRAISSMDAASYLDVKYNNIEKLAQVVNR